MDIRLLRAFVEGADRQTFSDAALALSITQPAFTKQIQQIESLVGTPLFSRGRHGAVLTAAGTELVGEARTIVDLVARFEGRAKRVGAGEEGHLTIGFGLSSITIAPRAVAAFRASSPGVSVRLEDMSSSAQVDGVRTGELDVGFTRLPVPRDLRAVSVLSDHLAIAYPAEWEPPADDAAFTDWLDEHPLVRLSVGRGPGLAAQAARYVSDVGAQPTIVQDADDLQTVLALVAAGVGIGIVPESARNIAPRHVRMRRLNGTSASWKIGVVWNPTNETPVVRSFLDELATLPRTEA
ncbi:LysR family transcriptional regulator [Microbacterium luteolum]|jgi:DNA-binding transcriptional LysR family regulator|uniref:LysR family transcriptional regulator n=1 Tax=Microbacterium luteolum TaxID=69367 RepID=A0ABY7XTI9_MICLT|nr:LysR family transcriptional regulator [Microbacterium luteolum]WDM44463.1 LysR family transcriptional regulator [Microbacterium luteolum]